MFFDSPYWSSLVVRHCLDVMHIEKNVCDDLIRTLINIQGKKKDDKSSRLDMVPMSIRQQLTQEELGKRTYFPPTCHTLSKKEKNVLHGIEVIQWYSANIKKLIYERSQVNYLKIT